MGPAWFGRLDRLAIDDGGAGSGLASDRSTHALAQDAVNALPGASPAPEAKRVEHRGPWALLTAQRAPGAARAQQVEDAVENAAQTDAARSPSRLGAWEQRAA